MRAPVQQMILLLAVTAGALWMCRAAEADEGETRQGLIALYSGGDHSIQTISRRIAFDWSDSSPDGRIDADFDALWAGRLLIRQPGMHRFHVMVTGAVSIAIDEETVLQVQGENVFHTAVPTDLSAGEHQLRIRFDRAGQRDAKLQLFWSSPEFTLEPLPADVLFHESDDSAEVSTAEITSGEEPADTEVIDAGRRLVDALRCAACHSELEELPVAKAPTLSTGAAASRERIVQRLVSSEPAHSDSRMPQYEFRPEEAENIAMFLEASAKDRNAGNKTHPENQNAVMPKRDAGGAVRFKAEDAEKGERLLLTVGCAACHRLGQLSGEQPSNANPWRGPGLDDVAERRSAEWLITWLKSPEELNADHTMPVFELSDDERRQIAAALTRDRKSAHAEPSAAGIDEKTFDAAEMERKIADGKRLVVESRCANCHQISGVEKQGATATTDWALSAGRPRSCLAERERIEGDPVVHRPRFRLTPEERTQIESWLSTVKSPLRPASGFHKGELLVMRSGCIACHDRDQQRGLSRFGGVIEAKSGDLRGQSQALIPPALTAVGDKLKDEYLASAVAGEQARRLPWLHVRMPKFRWTENERADLVRYFTGADRIPDAADEARSSLFEHYNPHHPVLATAGELLAGNQLTGAAGFNCIACHKAGPYEPRNVAMGTRGSDIMSMGNRLRSRYFLRWMQNPIRVVPGIEMPAIRRAIPGVAGDSLPEQIAVVWKSLADPRFSPPTVVSRYEQFVTVGPGEAPRIIRDVFTTGNETPRQSVARAFAAGFANGHNLLLDLDTMQLRQWTVGEFARQRTEGKSWFWDMAGVIVSNDPLDLFVCRLQAADAVAADGRLPVRDQRRSAELLSWKKGDQFVRIRVRYYFDMGTENSAAAGAKASRDPAAAGHRSRHTEITAWNDPKRELLQAVVEYEMKPMSSTEDTSGWHLTAFTEECPPGFALRFDSWRTQEKRGDLPWTSVLHAEVPRSGSGESAGVTLTQGQTGSLSMQTAFAAAGIVPPVQPRPPSAADVITSLPGFEGRRLPIAADIMPTAMTWLPDGRLAFASLRGQIWIAADTDGDSLPDSLTLYAEGLSAPYGIHADGDSILAAHKPEVVRLRDADRNGIADEFEVFASGWGYSDDYHDWTTGLVRDQSGRYFVGLGSDYSQNNRPADNDRWRGTILRIDTSGAITPEAYSFRFPMGLAFDSHNHLFATDNQGVQNTFNEINHVITGRHYGVPSRHETIRDEYPETPALMVPHPWTRSVNSIVFFPEDYSVPELAGHGVGCEYDTRCLIRFTVQNVAGTLQGASYRFSLPDQPGGGANFVGPVSSAFGPDGALYIGSIWDSGWQGGTNTGTIERLIPKDMPNGIREIRAYADGFEVVFFRPLSREKAENPANWSLQGYTRAWGGSYATPDSDRHALIPAQLNLSEDLRTVRVTVNPLRAGYVYEISVKQPLDDSEPDRFWPSEGHYTMKVVPAEGFPK